MACGYRDLGLSQICSDHASLAEVVDSEVCSFLKVLFLPH